MKTGGSFSFFLYSKSELHQRYLSVMYLVEQKINVLGLLHLTNLSENVRQYNKYVQCVHFCVH